MRILFIVSWYSPKNMSVIREGIFHYEQACALNKNQGIEVAIYFPFDNSIQNDFSDEIEHGIRVFRRKQKNGRIGWWVERLKDYNRINKQFCPDVIHAHVAGSAGLIACMWNLFYKKPYLLTEHSPLELMQLDSKKAFLLHKLCYKNSFSNICVSHDLCEKLQKKFPKQKFEVIYNGVFIPAEQVYGNSCLIEKKHKINCAIVAAFYDKEIKGYQYLLPAVQGVVKSGFDICLYICGGGEFLEFYKNLAFELGIAERCIFYGQIEKNKVYWIMSQMDFVISASLFESAGVSVEEAMLLGKPLLVTKSGGSSSLVTEKTAIVVEKGSTEALIQGIKVMISELKRFDSKEIKNYAYENFEIDSVCKQYIKLYRQILEFKK